MSASTSDAAPRATRSSRVVPHEKTQDPIPINVRSNGGDYDMVFYDPPVQSARQIAVALARAGASAAPATAPASASAQAPATAPASAPATAPASAPATAPASAPATAPASASAQAPAPAPAPAPPLAMDTNGIPLLFENTGTPLDQDPAVDAAAPAAAPAPDLADQDDQQPIVYHNWMPVNGIVIRCEDLHFEPAPAQPVVQQDSVPPEFLVPPFTRVVARRPPALKQVKLELPVPRAAKRQCIDRGIVEDSCHFGVESPKPI
jgi:hypothetical protein